MVHIIIHYFNDYVYIIFNILLYLCPVYLWVGEAHVERGQMSGVYKLSILQRCDQDSERARGRRRGK